MRANGMGSGSSASSSASSLEDEKGVFLLQTWEVRLQVAVCKKEMDYFSALS